MAILNNVFYFRVINSIGGIETFFYQLAKKYKDYDITIYYKTADKEQLRRLKKYVRCIQYNGEHIKCERIFFNFNLDIIDNVEAKEYYQIAHGDYKAMRVKPNIHPKLTNYLGVSQLVCDTYEEITGCKTKLCYNPIEVDKPQKVLHLISATRLTREKGKERIIKLGNILNASGVPYIWTIFTNDKNEINNQNIVYMKPRLDISNYIADSDYLVQLSDNEGYCYSVVESLILGTPVIVTDMPVMKEIGVNETNGFILDFDLTNVPIKEIYKGLPKFKYTPKKDNWKEFLIESKSTYKEENEMYKVKSRINFTDLEANKKRIIGEEFTCDKDRYEYLLNHKAVELIEEIKETKELEVKTEEAKKKTTKKKTTKKK